MDLSTGVMNNEYCMLQLDRANRKTKLIINAYDSGKCIVRCSEVLIKFNGQYGEAIQTFFLIVIPDKMKGLTATNLTSNSAVLTWMYPAGLIHLPRSKCKEKRKNRKYLN